MDTKKATEMVSHWQKTRLRLFVVALVVAICATPLSPGVTNDASAAISPGYIGNIVFESTRDSGAEIYIMDADGSDQTRLTNSTGVNEEPQISPDGSKIAFTSSRDGNREIYVMNIDGSNQVNLTNLAAQDRNPVWSPDSEKIVFETNRDGDGEIYIMDADGSDQTRLTNVAGTDNEPQISPDGSKLTFSSFRDGSWTIYTMDIDGSNQTKVSAGGDDGWPQWTPDGSKIVFESWRDTDGEIYVVDADGSNERNITNTPNNDERAWMMTVSQDSSKVAVGQLAADYSSSQLLISNIDGSGTETHDLASYGLATIESIGGWSLGDDKILAYGLSSTWEGDLYLVSTNDWSAEKLTSDGKSRGSPAWQLLPNSPPTTSNDTASTAFNTPYLVDVLANDSDEESLNGANLSVASQPTHGNASVIDGKIRYAPTLGYQGSDSFTYQICDSFMLDQKCSTGTVSITILPPGAPAITVTNINGEMYKSGVNSYAKSNLRPTFSGTATPGSEIKVEIHSDPIILTTTADGDGNWSITPSFDLPSGEHTVYISASLAGFTTEMEGFGLTVGGLARTGDDLWVLVMIAIGVTGSGLELLHKQRRIR